MGSYFKRRAIRMAVPVIALSVVLAGAGTAQAVDEPDAGQVDAIAGVVLDAAPAGSSAASNEYAEVEEAGGRLTAGSVVLPESGDGTLTSTSSGVQVDLPSSLASAEPEISEDGLVVYPSDEGGESSAVVAVTNLSASVQVVIPDADAPSSYAFGIEGASPVLNEDGGVSLLSDGEIVAEVAVPWAIDANGEAVPTRYEVDGNDIVQVVEVSASTAFPVVADPDFIFIAKCAAAAALFIAQNAVIASKFWKVFKSAKALVAVFKSLKGMKLTTKIKYVANQLGVQAGKLSGVSDLILRCTP